MVAAAGTVRALTTHGLVKAMRAMRTARRSLEVPTTHGSVKAVRAVRATAEIARRLLKVGRTAKELRSDKLFHGLLELNHEGCIFFQFGNELLEYEEVVLKDGGLLDRLSGFDGVDAALKGLLSLSA